MDHLLLHPFQSLKASVPIHCNYMKSRNQEKIPNFSFRVPHIKESHFGLNDMKMRLYLKIFDMKNKTHVALGVEPTIHLDGVS